MYYCIVNPSARSGKGKEIWKKLEGRFKEAGLEFKAVMTKGPGHATELAEKLTTAERDPSEYPIKLVVLGGDGTLNEVINGINDFDKTLVGYIPIGSSNDFSRDLDFPKKTEERIERIVKGEVFRTLDLGRLIFNSVKKPSSGSDGKPISKIRMFDVSAGIGYDAAVCQMANTSGTKSFFNKIGLGKLTYGIIALRELFGAEKVPCDIILDDETTIHVDHFIFAAAMVHHYEGGGFNFAPKADLTDGKFDLVFAGDMPSAKMLFALPMSFFGNYYWIKGIGHHVVKRVTIKTKKPLWVHTDGEVALKSDNITFECLQQKLQMMN